MDDGPKTLEQSLEMLRLAVDNGTIDIVASPHANNEFKFEPEVVAGKIEELRQAVNGSIRIHSGCDFHPWSIWGLTVEVNDSTVTSRLQTGL